MWDIKADKVLVVGQDGRKGDHPAPHHALPMSLMISVDTMDQNFAVIND